MPRAKPDRSFEVAVRHLFRHIGDAIALRRNPLVSGFFNGESNHRADQVALETIRTRILRAAAACRSQEIASTLRTPANRRYEIISAICAGERPSDTALKLGLSSRQYYRDRHDICTSVARLFMTLRPISLGPIDIREPMQLALRRAASLVEQGFAAKAVSLLEDTMGQAEPAAAKTLARLSLVKALIQFGDIPRAQESLSAARDFLEHLTSAVEDAELLRDRVCLAKVDVAIATGRDAEATSALESLVKRQEARKGDPSSDEVALQTFLESCSNHLMNGRFSEARIALTHAHDLAARMSYTPPELAVYLAVYAASCCEDGSVTPDVIVSRNYDALRLSVSIASARGAMYAMMGLMRAHLRMGNETEAYKWFLQLVEVARTMEGKKPLVSAAIVGADLLETRYWREAGQLSFEAQAFTRPGTLKWARLQGAQGKFLARSRNFQNALVALSNAVDLTRTLRNVRAQGEILRERGIVLYRLGRKSESVECIRHALALAESGTSALSLYRTYSAGAVILSDDRLARKATRMRPPSSATGIGGKAALLDCHRF